MDLVAAGAAAAAGAGAAGAAAATAGAAVDFLTTRLAGAADMLFVLLPEEIVDIF